VNLLKGKRLQPDLRVVFRRASARSTRRSQAIIVWGRRRNRLGPTNTVGLFVVLYLLNAIELFVYVALQILLVVRTLQDRWPLGDIAFGLFFFVVGQVILYAASTQICTAVSHYLDGLFFATICNLLGVMMVYKYWDSITREDLEFSVGTRMNNWEVKELLPEEDRHAAAYAEDPYGHAGGYDHSYSPSPAPARYSARY